jgi:uncharacterized membrane protein YphA (DoxX/SURF4 family)|tara:strand:- start:101 stop:634 length:534 start_codon:yes stop_codon:yes gene_type:complete
MQNNGGALLLGRILVALFFLVDGSYKTSEQAWPGYRDFVYEKFNLLGLQHDKIGFGGLGDVCAGTMVVMELLGAVLLLLGLRSYGAGVLIAYLIPMSLISHTFVVERGIDMTQFLPFLQGLALVGSLVVMGSYSEEEDDRPVSIENSRDGQREANPMDFRENELPPSSDRTGLYRRK